MGGFCSCLNPNVKEGEKYEMYTKPQNGIPECSQDGFLEFREMQERKKEILNVYTSDILKETIEKKQIVTLKKHVQVNVTKDMRDPQDLCIIFDQLQLIFIAIRLALQQKYCFKEDKDLLNYASQLFKNLLLETQQCAALYNTKTKELIDNNKKLKGKYVIMFNPLDDEDLASFNAGSTFIIWKRNSTSYRRVNKDDIYQNAEKIVCSGYCFYGASTIMVIACGFKVNGYTFEEDIGEFIMTHKSIKVPKKPFIYGIDSGKQKEWDANILKFVKRKWKQKDQKPHYYRYIGSLVADAHRTLMYGGIMLYPGQTKIDEFSMEPMVEGKINLIDALAIGYVFEKAWGRASFGELGCLMQISVLDLQQNIQLFYGNSDDINELENLFLYIQTLNEINDNDSVDTLRQSQIINGPPVKRRSSFDGVKNKEKRGSILANRRTSRRVSIKEQSILASQLIKNAEKSQSQISNTSSSFKKQQQQIIQIILKSCII